MINPIAIPTPQCITITYSSLVLAVELGEKGWEDDPLDTLSYKACKALQNISLDIAH